MPVISDFKCNHCDQVFELAKPDGGDYPKSCPSCGSEDIQKVYRSAPAGIVKGYSYKNGYSKG